MADEAPKKKQPIAITTALLLGLAGGAGAQRAIAPAPLPVQAQVVALRLLGDGQLAVALQARMCEPATDKKQERCSGVIGRELQFKGDGAGARLNGVPISDPNADKLGAAAAAFARAAAPAAAAMADRLVRP